MLQFISEHWTPGRGGIGRARYPLGNCLRLPLASRSSIKLQTSHLLVTLTQSAFGYSLNKIKELATGQEYDFGLGPMWGLTLRDVEKSRIFKPRNDAWANVYPSKSVTYTDQTLDDNGAYIDLSWTIGGLAKGGRIVVKLRLMADHDDPTLKIGASINCDSQAKDNYAIGTFYFPHLALKPITDSGGDMVGHTKFGGFCTKGPILNSKAGLYGPLTGLGAGPAGGIPTGRDWTQGGRYLFKSPEYSKSSGVHPGVGWTVPWFVYGYPATKATLMVWMHDDAGSWPKKLTYYACQGKWHANVGVWLDGDSKAGNLGYNYDIPVFMKFRAWQAETKWIECEAALYWREKILPGLSYYTAAIPDRHDVHDSVKDARVVFQEACDYGDRDPTGSPAAPSHNYGGMVTALTKWKSHFKSNAEWDPDYIITQLQTGPHRHGWNLKLGEEPLLRDNDDANYPNWADLIKHAYDQGIYYLLYYGHNWTSDFYPIPFSQESSYEPRHQVDGEHSLVESNDYVLYGLCDGDRVSRASYRGVVHAWHDIGCGTYYDTVGAFSGSTCRYDNHPEDDHPIGGGHWYNEKVATLLEECASHDGILASGLNRCKHAEHPCDYGLRWMTGFVYRPDAETERAVPPSHTSAQGNPEFRYFMPLMRQSLGPRYWTIQWQGHMLNMLADTSYLPVYLRPSFCQAMIYTIAQGLHNGTKLSIYNNDAAAYGFGTKVGQIPHTLLDDTSGDFDELISYFTNWVKSLGWLGDYLIRGYMEKPLDSYTVGRGALSYAVYDYGTTLMRLYSNDSNKPEAVNHSVWRHHNDGSLALVLTNWTDSPQTWSGDWVLSQYGVSGDFALKSYSWPSGGLLDSHDYNAKDKVNLSIELPANGNAAFIAYPVDGLPPGQAESGGHRPPQIVWGVGDAR